MKSKTLIIGAMVLIFSNIVYAIGISEVSPEYIELLPGESGRFVFQVQSVAVPRDLNCVHGVEGQTPMIVEFDEPVSDIAAGSVEDILATVTVPEDTPYGSYKVDFCTHCAFGQDVPEGQSSVRFSTCGLEVNIDVVGERTRLNMPLPAKPFVFEIWMFVLLLIAVILIIGLVWWYTGKKHKKKK